MQMSFIFLGGVVHVAGWIENIGKRSPGERADNLYTLYSRGYCTHIVGRVGNEGSETYERHAAEVRDED